MGIREKVRRVLILKCNTVNFIEDTKNKEPKIEGKLDHI